MSQDQVLVPPEVRDGLDQLGSAGALAPDDRQAALEAADERGLEDTVRWLDRVDDSVYDRAASGAYEAADEH